MRLNIDDQFIVGVVRPSGGWSKGRPIAYIEEDDKCVPSFDLLIPNDLDDEEVARYVSEKFRAFAQAGNAQPLWRARRRSESRPQDNGNLETHQFLFEPNEQSGADENPRAKSRHQPTSNSPWRRKLAVVIVAFCHMYSCAGIVHSG